VTLTTLFAMGLTMTSAPVVSAAVLQSLGKYTNVPQWPIKVTYAAPSDATEDDPGLAHLAAAQDFQRRRFRIFELTHTEDLVGWVDALSKWELSGFGSAPLDFDVPGSSPTETIQIVFEGKPELQTSQESRTQYTFKVRLRELVHAYPS
jgi:hypothetical protein